MYLGLSGTTQQKILTILPGLVSLLSLQHGINAFFDEFISETIYLKINIAESRTCFVSVLAYKSKPSGLGLPRNR